MATSKRYRVTEIDYVAIRKTYDNSRKKADDNNEDTTTETIALCLFDGIMSGMFRAINLQATPDSLQDQADTLTSHYGQHSRSTIFKTKNSKGISLENWKTAISIAQNEGEPIIKIWDSDEFQNFKALFNMNHVLASVIKFATYKGEYPASYNQLMTKNGMDAFDIIYSCIPNVSRIASLGYKSENAHCQVLAGLYGYRLNGEEYQPEPSKAWQYEPTMRTMYRIAIGRTSNKKMTPILSDWASLT